MDRKIAEGVVDVLRRVDGLMGELHELSCQMNDEDEAKNIRRVSGGVVLDLYEGITQAIVKQYPDLHPDPECR